MLGTLTGVLVMLSSLPAGTGRRQGFERELHRLTGGHIG